MAVEVFVYYRVPAAQTADLRRRVHGAHDSLRRDLPGLQARLLRRPSPDAQGDHTWMETYAGPAARNEPSGFVLDAAARHAIERTMVQALGTDLLHGPRHVEVFEAD
jgi:hypothetical protein